MPGCPFFTFAIGVFVKVAFARFEWKFASSFPVLFALIVGYILSIIVGIVDYSAIKDAALIGLPNFTLPKFSGYALSVTVPVAIVTMVEHFGDVLAIGNVVDKDFLDDPGIHRTLLGDGLAASLSAFIGWPANTTYSKNTGAVALTGNFNPIIMKIATLFAILLSLIPKFTAVVSTIPGPVIVGITILLFGMISSIGIKNMSTQKLISPIRNFSLLQLSCWSSDLAVQELNIGKFGMSGLGLTVVVCIILNAILNYKTFKKA